MSIIAGFLTPVEEFLRSRMIDAIANEPEMSPQAVSQWLQRGHAPLIETPFERMI